MRQKLLYHGAGLNRRYFEGWYFKHEAGGRTLALIPGIHVQDDGHEAAFLQVVTDGGTWMVPYGPGDFAFDRTRGVLRLGENRFSPQGLQLRIHVPGLDLEGQIHYGHWKVPRYDIMGPFRLTPGMECCHSVFSLRHRVDGRLWLNGQLWQLEDGVGYIEGDRGRSFPKNYLWTQCSNLSGGNAVMLSIADIPYLGMEFQGCIATVLLEGREYRLATYKGARVESCTKEGAVVRQGNWRLSAQRLDDSKGHGLRAPTMGAMARTIHENAACPMHFSLWLGDRLALEADGQRSSFEYVNQEDDHANYLS